MPNALNAESAPRKPETIWFAVHTRHQHENLVAASLLNKGVEVFLPTYESVRRWSDRKKRIRLPLFPGYLFFAAKPNQWGQIASAPGVTAILMAGKIPAEIPSGEINAIRRMVESTLRVEPHPFLKEGDLVRINAGLLAGLEGIVLRKKDALRIVLSIPILGQSASVEIDGFLVERVRPRRHAIPDFPGGVSRDETSVSCRTLVLPD
jgi:transcription antitermination factor NusG